MARSDPGRLVRPRALAMEGGAHDEGDGEVVQRHQGLWLHHADKDAFVHISEVERSGLGRLIEGQRVNFQVRQEARGLKAVELAPDD